MSRFSNLLLWLSGTDVEIVSRMSKHVRTQREIMGGFVFTTSVFAYISGCYALSLITGDLAVALFVGLLYGYLIMLFDRAIVSSPTKKTALARLPIALLIGVIVAVPVEMLFYRDSINVSIKKKINLENETYYAERDINLSGLKRNIAKLEERLAEYQEKNLDYSEMERAEHLGLKATHGVEVDKEQLTGKTGKGAAYDEAQRLKAEYRRQIEAIENKLDTARIDYNNRYQQLTEELNQKKIDYPNDILARMEALHVMMEGSVVVTWSVSLLSCFFILVELFPAMYKLMASVSDYDLLMAQKNYVFREHLRAYANEKVRQVKANPSNEPRQDENGGFFQ